MRLPAPATLALPFADWRPQQSYAVKRTQKTTAPFVVLQLPTGAGKSGIALALLRQSHRRGVVLTSTLALQDQYAATAPWLCDARGMRNYECLAAKDQFKRFFPARRWVGCDEGPCRADFKCQLRENGCTFFDADREMRQAQSVVTSYSKWLASRRYANGMGAAPLLICDEAHHLADELMSACRIEIPRGLVREKRPRTIAAWKAWAASHKQRLDAQVGESTARLQQQPLRDKLGAMAYMHPDTWAWEDTERGIAFEPVVPRLLLPLLVGQDQQTTVFLSATVTPDILALVGVPRERMEFITFPSTFDVARRPFYCLWTARVDYRTSLEDWLYVIETIDAIIGARLDRKGLVHSVSFDRGEDIWRRSAYQASMILHRRGEPITDALAAFDRRPAPAILVSPSITTGHDFPGSRAEYQILPKLPFPDTRSRIAKARIEHTPEYRDQQTMQTLVQTTGRIMRSDDDQGESFLLDNHIRWFLKRAERFAPSWWLDAVFYEDREIPRPPRRLAA